MPYYPTAIPSTLYLLDQLPPVSQLKPISWTSGLSDVTTTRRLATFSKFFYGLPIDSLRTFKGPLISLAKTPLKFWFHISSLFNSAILNFQWVPGHAGSPGNKHADSLHKAGPLCLLRWSHIPLPSYCQNFLHPESQMETSYFHIPPPISTLPMLQFLRWNWSSHAPNALSFPPSLPRSKPLAIVVSQF